MNGGRPGHSGGNAAIEFVVIVPFVLVLGVVIWNVRSFILHRTELVREPYTVAEAIADQTEGTTAPFENALGQLRARLAQAGTSGSLAAAVVVRGTDRSPGVACPPTDWCPPRVIVAWPTIPGAESWPSGGVCAGGSNLPALNAHFAANQVLLTDENADPDGAGPLPPPPEEDWPSRNMADTEWWVVIDTCFHPGSGIGFGQMGFVNPTALVLPELRRRVVWPSIHDLDDCEWCP